MDPIGLGDFWGNLQNTVIGGVNAAHQWATGHAAQLEATANFYDNVSTVAGFVEAGCGIGAAGATALGVTAPADLVLIPCAYAAAQIGGWSLVGATALHGFACWGGAGKTACENALIDAFNLPLGWVGGKAWERVAEHFVGREVLVRGCEYIWDQMGEIVKKAVTGR